MPPWTCCGPSSGVRRREPRPHAGTADPPSSSANHCLRDVCPTVAFTCFGRLALRGWTDRNLGETLLRRHRHTGRARPESANWPAQVASRDPAGGLVSQAPVRARLSWPREVMPSLVKTLPRWYWTVRGLRNSREAISGFDSPSAASRTSNTGAASRSRPPARPTAGPGPCRPSSRLDPRPGRPGACFAWSSSAATCSPRSSSWPCGPSSSRWAQARSPDRDRKPGPGRGTTVRSAGKTHAERAMVSPHPPAMAGWLVVP